MALVITGVLTLDDALRLVATRARLISEKCLPNMSNMTSVRVSVEQVTPLLAGLPGLRICCFNECVFLPWCARRLTDAVLVHPTRR